MAGTTADHRPVRVAIVGLGYFSQFHQSSWRRIEGAELAGVCDLDETKAGSAAQATGARAFTDLATMLAELDPDILDIVTPPPTHASHIRLALKPGRLIACQKPFCQSLEEARGVTAEAESAGASLVVHDNFRFQPWYREVKRLIDNDLLGTIYQCRFDMRPGDGRGEDAYLSRQPSFQGMKRFLVRETAVHFLDLFSWLFGDVASIFADLRQLNPVIAGEDAGTLLMHHDGGVFTIFDANRLSDHIATDRRKTLGEMLVEGEKGALRLDGGGRLFFRAFGENEEQEIPFEYEDRDFAGGSVEALNRHLLDHIVAGRDLENRAREYLRIVALEEAAYRSAELGRTVTI
jgi:predicted dehydrogenase